MSEMAVPLGEIGEVLQRAKQAAIDYYRLTGKPLGVTGEVGEYEAARLLGLTLADARAPGYDATDQSGRRYLIKARAFSDAGRRKSQRLGAIKLDHAWEAVLLVLMDENLGTLEIWEAERSSVAEALSAPGSKARNERGALAVSSFKRIAKRVWPA
jgi:hypothetical protein